MKPTKNHKICPICGQPRITFETKKKALNFIKYNRNDIEDKGELRPYYCDGCAGWHITSHKFKTCYNYKTKHLLDAYEFSRKAKDMFRNKVKTCLLLIKKLI